MKGDEISLRHLGTSWEGKGHVVKVPDSILHSVYAFVMRCVFLWSTSTWFVSRFVLFEADIVHVCNNGFNYSIFHATHIHTPTILWQFSVWCTNCTHHAFIPISLASAVRLWRRDRHWVTFVCWGSGWTHQEFPSWFRVEIYFLRQVLAKNMSCGVKYSCILLYLNQIETKKQ